MNRLLIAAYLLPGPLAICQNLVVDPGFENYVPNGTGLLLQDFLYDWESHLTTDYYNSALQPGVIAYTGTDARSGQGFIGEYVYGSFPGWPSGTAYNREYTYGRLVAPLEAGRYYQVEMYVKPMSKPPVIPYCIDRFGIYFSTFPLTDHVPDHFLHVVNAQVENTNGLLCDEQNWTRISGCFRARGGEQFLVIGNFETDLNTQHQLLPGDTTIPNVGPWAYLLFDDISVMPLDDRPLGGATHTLCFDSTLSLDATFPNAISYNWNTGETTPQILVGNPGLITVEITTDGGCLIRDTAAVRYDNCTACEPVFPNAFTPNQDGRNDGFGLMTECYFTEYSFSVYDRWGEVVFRSHDPHASWDGMNHGRLCPIGVYAYCLNATTSVQSKGAFLNRSGNVTLIR
jgi:gliding motility-associated-like protein